MPQTFWILLLTTMTTYLTFIFGSRHFPLNDAKAAQDIPDEKTFFGSGIDFAEISAFCSHVLHPISHSVELSLLRHRGEKKRMELTASNHMHQKTCMSKALHLLPLHNRREP